VKYMVLIYNRPGYVDDLPEAQRTELFGDVDRIMKELTESGEMIDTHGLQGPEATKTVRVRDGGPAITDGPFIEAKEQFAGTLMIDVESEERAIEIAASWPDSRYAAMEVRAVMQTASEDV
jgi:hypothetical protein